MTPDPKTGKFRPEDFLKPTDKAIEKMGADLRDFYDFKNNRDQSFRQIQHLSLEEFWKQSRELFWNSTVTKSEDLEALGLDFSLPFIRKEVLDFTGSIVSMNIAPQLAGEGLNGYSVKVLQAMYKKWRFKSKDKVEKFWQLLYGAMNGTVVNYIGYDASVRQLQYMSEYDRATGDYTKTRSSKKFWDDAYTEIVPLEELYLQKIWERNIQKQGKTVRLKEMTKRDFDKAFPVSKFPLAQFVVPGAQLDDDSLFFKLLGGSGMLNPEKVQVLYSMDTDTDEYTVNASGIWINPIGKKNDDCRPNPFAHKSQPYTMSVHMPIDEKFAYGMSMPFNLKDPSKILNTSYTMFVERELRAIDPPIISSDFEAPDLIFGQQRVIPVNDIDAYKEFQISEASGTYLTMMNSMQGMMSTFAQGGMAQIAPSVQPRSAKEINEMNILKQKTLGNTLVLYYDLLHQEIMLVLKTMMQFYQAGKYGDQNLIRSFSVPNFPLSQGGLGNIEVRFVKDPQDGLRLYFEAVEKSIENGHTTEIIEVPIELIQNLEFFINDIKLEPEKSDDMERAAFNEQVLQPLLNVFIPAGVADMSKTYLRFLEKMGEHPSSFTSEQNMPQMMASWGGAGMAPQAPMGGFQGRQNSPVQQGNMNQSVTGQRFGGQSNGGIKQPQVQPQVAAQ